MGPGEMRNEFRQVPMNRQAKRVSSVANVCSEHLLRHHTVTLHPHQIHSASLSVCSPRIAKSRGTLHKFRTRSRLR